MGYHRAGFDVLGIDIKPQPNYPFEFIQMDAVGPGIRTMILRSRVQAIHASPPCQAFSSMTKGRWQDREHPDLVDVTRRMLVAAGLPYVIENVVGAPLINPVLLCGTMFGLQSENGNQLRRHRLFEISPALLSMLPQCQHNKASAIGVYGGGQHPSRRKRRYSAEEEGVDFGIAERRRAMGIDWMSGKELNQAIPPAYTEWIGEQIIGLCGQRGAA